MVLAIVLPTFAEGRNIGPLLDRLETVLEAWQPTYWVIDDESPDGTAMIVRGLQRDSAFGARLRLSLAPRRGLGTALVRGFRLALADSPRYLVQMDADGSHRPEDVPRLLETLDKGADLVIGSRRLASAGFLDHRPHWRRALSRVAQRFAEARLPLAISDATNGFRAWRGDALAGLDFHATGLTGYGFQVALLRQALTRGLVVREVPTPFVPRLDGRSKLGWRDLFEFAQWAWRTPTCRWR